MAQPATRSLGRLSEIAQVMVRHGFGYFLEAHKLTDLLPGRSAGTRLAAAGANGSSARGEHLRELLDALGPTFVKFEQLLSTRPDGVAPDQAGARLPPRGAERADLPPELRRRSARARAEGLLDVHPHARAHARVARGHAARRRRPPAAEPRGAPRPRVPNRGDVDGDDLPPRVLPR